MNLKLEFASQKKILQRTLIDFSNLAPNNLKHPVYLSSE